MIYKAFFLSHFLNAYLKTMFLFLYFLFCFPGLKTEPKLVILKPGDGTQYIRYIKSILRYIFTFYDLRQL